MHIIALAASNIEYPERFVRHIKATLKKEKISTQKDRNLAKIEHALKGVTNLKAIAEIPQFLSSNEKGDIKEKYSKFRMMLDIVSGMKM